MIRRPSRSFCPRRSVAANRGGLARQGILYPSTLGNRKTSYLKQLEEIEGLEAGVIRNTKVHKVLKAIIKLESIPKDPEYQFKDRSTKLLASWQTVLAADADNAGDAAATASAPATNGVKHDEKKDEADASNSTEKPKDTVEEAPKATNGDSDVAMSDAKEETPAVKADTVTEGAPETATT